MTNQNVFLNPETQTKLEIDGYVVISALSQDDIYSLRAAHEKVKSEAPADPFYTSHWSPDLTHRRRVDEMVRPILSDKLLPLFENYKAIYGYYLVKNPGIDSCFRAHQDWTLVDEPKEVGITAWCPLIETNSSNGAFHVVRGSHKFLNNIRGTNIDPPYRSILPYIESQFMTPVYIKPGEVILFDQRLWHYSPANMSGVSRVSAGLVLIPQQTKLIHYCAEQADGSMVREIKKYFPGDDFLQTVAFGQPQDESKLVSSFNLVDGEISERDMDKLYGTNNRSPRPIFQTKSNEAAFFDKGYFTTQLLSDEQVASCLHIIKSLEASISEGKYNSLEVMEDGHRKQIKVELENIIGDTILKFFLDYKFIGFNAAVKKESGDTEFLVHIDDIHVNEAEANSVNVWIPLVDVDESNGALYMVPNSHKLPQPVRGIGLPFAFADKAHLIEKHKISLNLKAGEAIIFHTKMIHGSPINESGKERPAIITGLIPAESEPIVFLKHDELSGGMVEKFHAPQEFYWNLTFDKKPDGFRSFGLYEHGHILLSDEEFESIICN